MIHIQKKKKSQKKRIQVGYLDTSFSSFLGGMRSCMVWCVKTPYIYKVVQKWKFSGWQLGRSYEIIPDHVTPLSKTFQHLPFSFRGKTNILPQVQNSSLFKEKG